MDIVDIASRDYIEVDVDERLGKVQGIFEESNPKGIIVTNDGEYAGVITQKKLLSSHVEDQTKVSTLMKTAPHVERTANIRDVARALVEGGTKVAPVFDGDELWGIITEDQILEAVVENLDALVVDQIYTENPVTTTEDADLGTVVNLLRENGISRLPVVNENGFLTGVVTTQDLVNYVVRDMDKQTVGDRQGEKERVLDMPVLDLMSSPVETTTPAASVRDAVETMLEKDYAGLVVTASDDDRVVGGILTKTDVLRALSYTEEDHLDIQITNIDLLETLTRDDIRVSIEEIAEKYQKMLVKHVHVRFQEHKEKLRGTPLIQCQIRMRTDQGQLAGSGEGYGAEHAFNVARDTLERNVIEKKGVQSDREYKGQLLRKLNEL